MSRAILSLSTTVLAVLLVSGVALAKPQPATRQVLDATCKRHGPSITLESFARSTTLVAQSFKPKHTGRLTSARVQVMDRSQVAPRNDEPTAIVMEIRAVDSLGIPTDKVEASTTIPAPDVPDRHIGAVTGNFRPGAPVEAGQQYALVLYPPAEGEISWGGSNTSVCPGVPSNTYETHPRVFQTIEGKADQFFATFVTTRETTGAAAKGGRLGDTGGLPVLVPALLTLLISGAAIRLLVGRRL